MHSSLLFTVLLYGLLIILTNAALYKDEHKIMQANKEQFLKLVEKNKYLFAILVRDNCTRCDEFYACTWPNADMIQVGSPGSEGVPMVRVDLTGETLEGYAALNITGLPAIRFYVNASYAEYHGEYNGKKVESWVDDKVQHYVHETKDEVFLYHYAMTYDTTVMYYPIKPTGENETTPFLAELRAVDKLVRGDYSAFGVSYTYLPMAKSKMNFTTAEMNDVDLVVWAERGEDRYNYYGPKTIEALYRFILDVSRPYYRLLNDNALQNLFYQPNKAGLFLISTKEFSEGRNLTMRQLAKENKDILTTVIAVHNQSDPYYVRLVKYLGVSTVVPPFAVIYDHKLKYRVQTELEPSDIKRFIDNFRQGTLQPYFKSGEPSTHEQNWKKEIIKVVSTSFSKQVVQSDQSVLVYFHATWCRPCERFNELFEDLFLRFKEKLIFARIDGQENDIESQDVPYFPTLRLFKKGNKSQPITFNGQLVDNELTEFLNTQLNLKIHTKEDL